MKEALTTLSLIAVMAFTSMAMATTWTATDNPNFNFGNGKSYNNILDLNGFTPGTDIITSAQLLLDFDKTGVITKIAFDGIKDSSWHLVVNGFGGYLSFDVPERLLADGKLDLGFSGYGFDFGPFKGLALASITINAVGPDPPPAPVPEPGTILLFSLGLMGISIYIKRRRNA